MAFSSTISAPWEFDDHPSIRLNPTIRSLSPDVLHPPTNTSVAGRPVVNLSLAVNYAINEWAAIDPDAPAATVGFHVVNMVFHLLCGLLLWGVVRRTLAHAGIDDDHAATPVSATLAGLITLVWLVHPIQTEAVAYVIQRTELLVSLFCVATLYASIRAWESATHARTWYVVGVLCCALGMGSKEVMIGAPLIVILYDRAFRVDSWRGLAQNRARMVFYACLLATMGIVIASVLTSARSASVGFDLGITWYQYLYTQAWAITRYVRLLFWPSGLTFDYGERAITGLAGVPGLILLTACGIGTLVAWTRPRWRWLGFLGAWFFLLLAPSSSVVPIRTEVAAERRIYLASAAVFVLVVLGANAARLRWRVGARAMTLAFGVLSVGLAIGTYVRGFVYRDTETLYRDVMAKAPDNPRGYLGVGLTLLARGPEYADESRSLFERAVALDSNHVGAWQSLGLLATLQEDWPAAQRAYEHALRLQPGNPDAAAGLERARREQ